MIDGVMAVMAHDVRQLLWFVWVIYRLIPTNVSRQKVGEDRQTLVGSIHLHLYHASTWMHHQFSIWREP